MGRISINQALAEQRKHIGNIDSSLLDKEHYFDIFARLPDYSSDIDYKDRFIGAIVGTAIGDAIGFPAESLSMEQVRERYGKVEGYLNPRIRGKNIYGFEKGSVTDDTQQTAEVLKCLVRYGYIDPEYLMQLFNSYMICAGPVVLEALHPFRFGIPWYDCGRDSFFNGGAMRAAPVGLFNFCSFEKLRNDALLSCWVTHANLQAAAGTIAMAYMTAFVAGSEPGYFNSIKNIKEFLQRTALSIEGLEEACRNRRKESLYERAMVGLLEVYESCRENPETAFKKLGNDVYAVQSVSAAIYCFLRSPDDFERAVLTAVNGGGDADSVASMTGTLCGAYTGFKSIPRWMTDGLKNVGEYIELAESLYDKAVQFWNLENKDGKTLEA